MSLSLRIITKRSYGLVVSLILVLSLLPLGLVSALSAGTFGSGTFGSCEFGSCSITISTSGSTGCSGSVCLNLTPNSSGSCSVNSDTVTVSTQFSGGYALSLGNNSTSTSMADGSYNISATSGTYASPVALAANNWGYRLDSVGSFGSGPTSSQSNVSIGSINSLTFAQTQPSSSAADTVASTSAASNTSGDNYTVWYGMCADTSIGYGTYSSQVIYTAVTN